MTVSSGTEEQVWQHWLSKRRPPTLNLRAWASGRAIVVAAHPDDEVLGAGGLLRRLARQRTALTIIWATDGEASHPGSRSVRADDLASRRRAEADEALRRLQVTPLETVRLGLPDGGVNEHEPQLAAALLQRLGPGDLVVTPWRHDGHPDHEAAGAAAALAASSADATLLEFPIWTWHWSHPRDIDDHLDRLAVLLLDRSDLAAKQHAINAFTSQIQPLGVHPGDEAILPPDVLAHFRRPVEVLFR